jgi:hypothetical protein
MRTISTDQWRQLEDLSAEGLLGGLPLQTAEKDIHITDLLERLGKLQVRHGLFKGLRKGEPSRIDDGIRLVFAGGTCLSKAHRLVNRMSEDIDIKVVLDPPSNELKQNVSSRGRLKALHAAICLMLKDLSLDIPEKFDGSSNPHVRDVHRYCVIAARYAGKGPALLSLRPELKIELIHRHPRIAPTAIEFGYLHEHLAGLVPTKTIAMRCISVAETVAEKVLSLLRRCAWKWSGLQADDMDPALVRHVYDVHRIMTQTPHVLDAAQSIFPDVVAEDAAEFRARDPAFDANPRDTLLRTLDTARVSEELRTRYAERLLPLLYDGNHVSYEEAFSSFEEAAQQLIARIST